MYSSQVRRPLPRRDAAPGVRAPLLPPSAGRLPRRGHLRPLHRRRGRPLPAPRSDGDRAGQRGAQGEPAQVPLEGDTSGAAGRRLDGGGLSEYLNWVDICQQYITKLLYQ